MPTFNYQVSASLDDGDAGSVNNDSGRTVTSGATFLVGNSDLTSSIVSPGSHNSNDEYPAIFRFLNIGINPGATIVSANFTITAQATYNAGANVIKYFVSAELAASGLALSYTNPGRTLRSASPPVGATARPRTTAYAGPWDLTSVTVDTEYSISVTSVIQEIVNQGGWAYNNAINMIMDTHPDCTQGEWQDFWAYDGSTSKAAKLSIVTAGGGLAPRRMMDIYIPLLGR